MTTKRPDFLLIGAQKAGTTSLFRYLVSHPAIYMPPEKELNFWSDHQLHAKGLDWYLSEYFAGASDRQVWGRSACGAYRG